MSDGAKTDGQPGAERVRAGATAGLDPAASHADFAARPVGRWLGGGSWVYAWPAPERCLTVLWGEPTVEDFEALTRLFEIELRPPATPHASLIDARRVERVVARAFEVLSHYVRAHREPMTRYVTRLAIVRPGGFVGALAAGFYEALESPYPVSTFDDPDAAAAWIDAPEGELSALSALAARISDVPELVRSVRGAITARLPEAEVETIARDVGVSVRTLQRKLKALGTTFQTEHAHVQVVEAQRRLAGSSLSISRIAYEVGCATPQHLSAIFRQATGQTPSAWRDAQR